MVRILIKLVLIFVLVFTAVSIWYGRVEDKLRKDSAPLGQTVTQQPEKKTEILRKPNDYTIIVKRNIFQAVVVKKEPVIKEIKPEGLKPTKLKLSLMGTISGSDSDARAIISDEVKRKQDIYQVGDSIQGAMIKSIKRGEVVLSVNGKDEVLHLEDRKGGGSAYTPSPSDFYQEPPKKVQPSANQEVQRSPSTPAGRQPAVRPRPVRRPSSLRGSRRAVDHSQREK